MRSFTFLAAASLAASAAAVPLDVSNDIAERQTKPYQIRGVQDPIYHLYLQSLPGDGTPVMGPEAMSEYFTIGNTIQSTNTSLYLNIGEASTSYLPLTFDATATTTAWGLEGDTIITTNGSPYGRRKCYPHLLGPSQGASIRKCRIPQRVHRLTGSH